MFLPSLYSLVDEAMEIQLYSNIRFMNFLDYPESVSDARTIWLFRERIADNHKDKEIWKQFDEKGIRLRRARYRMQLSLNPIPVMTSGRKVTGLYRLIRNFLRNRLIRKNWKLRDQGRK